MTSTVQNVRALGLFSGGLDSILAALLLRRQGIEVEGVAFVTPFFDAEKAKQAAERYQLPLEIVDISVPHLQMLKNPRYGYGKNMNPCIDCHAQMFAFAGRMLEERGCDFLFSGEVLGQRPKSQTRSALQAVDKASGHGGRILRPLSARLLPVTPMEESGWVVREQLENIQGRSRRRQDELARALGITEYPSAGGGCLLTEPSFSGRLRDLFTHEPDCTPRDVELLKHGRVFRLSPRARLSLGRHRSDNEVLKDLAQGYDVLVRNENVSGPLGVISGAPAEEDLVLAAALVASYGKAQAASQVSVRLTAPDQSVRIVEVEPLSRERAQELQL